MSSFLTQGRLELIDALQGNAHLTDAVRSWLLFGSGLHTRLTIEAGDCPFCSVAPAEYNVDLLGDVYTQIPQEIQVDLGVEGQDVEPLEEMIEALYDELLDAKRTRWGLSGEGLNNVQSTGTTWMARPDEEAAHLIWIATTRVRLTWRRSRPLSD